MAGWCLAIVDAFSVCPRRDLAEYVSPDLVGGGQVAFKAIPGLSKQCHEDLTCLPMRRTCLSSQAKLSNCIYGRR